jgi:hypothetical protein
MPIRPENRDRYPKDWKLISRIVKILAGERCECEGECGRDHTERCPELQGFPSLTGGERTITVLTTAHLDHVPENCEAENLKAMCQGCHLHYDREYHARSRLERLRREREAAGQQVLA